MKLATLLRLARRDRGMALVIVISALALISILIIAIFSVTRREYKATQSFVNARSAKQLGDMATAIVTAQIQNGHNTVTGATGRTIHATQPGMVRKYNSDGSFNSAYKLYSSTQMKVIGGDEAVLLSPPHVTPSAWNTQPARYVDLNEPVIRPGSAAADGDSAGYAVYFPIIDPRAFYNTGGGGQDAAFNGTPGTTQVEGFSYDKKTAESGSGASQDYSARTTTPDAASDAGDVRLPMPVEWMYVLQDGTLGTLDDGNTFISAGAAPTPQNPIVGRIAFWTDDESCKININTASEPTFAASPYYFHERDMRWAHYPGATGEYQRYPGHPATVALSAVLAPYYTLDPMQPAIDGLTQSQVVEIKENIYELLPKVHTGGSLSGTRPFVQDDVFGDSQVANLLNVADAKDERLFASVDEMLFKDNDFDATNGRVPARFLMPTGKAMFDHDTIERSRFFLSAHSRSPEFSIHGLPRLCMWPVPDESLGSDKRTSFDNMIALCGTIRSTNSGGLTGGSRTYFFRRAFSEHGSHDVTGSATGYPSSDTLGRNQELLNYLSTVLNDLQFPATSKQSQGSTGSFANKYGSRNANQLAIQFFDYIRSTNLYDGILARKNDAYSTWNKHNNDIKTASGTNDATAGRYLLREDNVRTKYTYTAPRNSQPPTSLTNINSQMGASNTRTQAEATVPGHGQVSPAKWTAPDGNTYKGFGRMFTLSEIGFQFICTADGLNDEGGSSSLQAFNGEYKGGGTAVRIDPTINTETGANPYPTAAEAYPNSSVLSPSGGGSVWFSNFPPLSDDFIPAAMQWYGCDKDTSELHPSRHPAFDPKNWNMTLAQNTPLGPDEKRVQMLLLLETFCPSLGWTQFNPEWTIVLDGDTVAQIQINDVKVFQTTGPVPVKSHGNIYRTDGVHSVGGHAGPSAIAGGRHVRGISQGGGRVLLPNDPNYDTNISSDHSALQNYPLVSDFITVKRNQPMRITFPNEQLKVLIYDTHDWQNATAVQTIYINLNGLPSEVPTPHLVGSSSPIGNNNTVKPGGPGNPTYHTITDSFGRKRTWRSFHGPHYWCGNFRGALGVLDGRFNPNYGKEGEGVWQTPPQFQNYVPYTAEDTAQRQVVRGRLDNNRNGVGISGESWQEVPITPDSTSDVIRSIVPAVGDYRIIAAMDEVPASMWMPHPLWKAGWENLRQAHSFTGYKANYEPGALFAVQMNSDTDWESNTYANMYNKDLQLVGGARHDIDKNGNLMNTQSGNQPDFPPDRDWAIAANAFGDFDAGISDARNGPYINKPDEGNFFAANETLNNQTKFFRSSYFYETWQNAEDWRSGIYMTPNRLVSSPGMFGSLPTGVFGVGSGHPQTMSGLEYAPWQTLLYRPHAAISNISPPSESTHPGAYDPADHYTMDLFFMPVVEPYAISEPLSTAGRINMNYQIMPFTHIRRATGMHAALKGEFITAIPLEDANAAKEFAKGGSGGWDNIRFTQEQSSGKYWHRNVDAAATLRQFDLRFNHQAGTSANSQGLFRSATQICELHLIPKNYSGSTTGSVADLRNASSQSQFDQEMDSFWGANRVTGDNVRERAYANVYAKLTTRSNTFRVHVRSQMLRKARSVAPNTFDPDKDAVVGEYRGSYLLERYIDPNDAAGIPDYAVSGGPFSGGKMPLDTYYRFKVLESKRFAP